jgi:hypothetical protein
MTPEAIALAEQMLACVHVIRSADDEHAAMLALARFCDEIVKPKVSGSRVYVDMIPAGKSCANCVYLSPTTKNGDEVIAGECRQSSPKMLGGIATAVWPEVVGPREGWCGEHSEIWRNR